MIRDNNDYDLILDDLEKMDYDSFIEEYKDMFFKYKIHPRIKDNVKFAIAIRQYCQKHNIGRAKLSIASGVSLNTINNYAKGYGHMTEQTITKIKFGMASALLQD